MKKANKYILKIIIVVVTLVILFYAFLCLYFHVSPTFILPLYASKGEWQYKCDDIQIDFTVNTDTDNYANGICHIYKDGILKEYDMRLNYFSFNEGGIIIWERCAGDTIEYSGPGKNNIALGGFFKVKLNKDIYFYNIKEGDLENVWNNKSEIILNKVK